jgi:membrane protein, antimicrobial resistance system
MGGVLDLIRVLFSPTEVFGRVRERPVWFVPAIALGIVVTILNYLFLPFRLASLAPQLAQAAARSPNAPAQIEMFQRIAVFASPIFVLILLLIVAGVLWLLVALLAGGDAKYRTLLSVATYTALPSLLLQAATLVVLKMKGVESVSSPLDLQPPLGLNLLAPNASGFMSGILAGINPFAIWSMVLTAIGIQVTGKTSRGSAYTVAIVAMVLAVLLGGLGAKLATRGAS